MLLTSLLIMQNKATTQLDNVVYYFKQKMFSSNLADFSPERPFEVTVLNSNFAQIISERLHKVEMDNLTVEISLIFTIFGSLLTN